MNGMTANMLHARVSRDYVTQYSVSICPLHITTGTMVSEQERTQYIQMADRHN